MATRSRSHISRADYFDKNENLVTAQFCLQSVMEVDIRYDDGDNSGVIDTGITLPDYVDITDVLLFNIVGEAGTIDIGVTGDPDGLADGLDTTSDSSIQILSLANGAETAGDLLKETTSSGPSRVGDASSGGLNIVYQASVDFSAYIGKAFIHYWNLSDNV